MQPKEKKTAHLSTARSCELSYQQHCCHKYRDYHQSDRCDRYDQQPDYCHQDNQCHNCHCCNAKDPKSNKSYKKKDDCKCNHFKKKSNKAMHNDQSSLLSAGNLFGKRSCSCSRSSLRSCSRSCSCLSSRSYDNHHVDHDDCKLSVPPKREYLYSSKSDDGVFATLMAKRGKRAHK
jgi:hypothetical protein